jgi:regulatory protein
VAPKLAEKAATDAFSATNEVEMVQAWLARKYRGKDLGALLREPAKLASVFRRLRMAGFSSGPSIQVLKRFAAEAEQLEGMDDEG